MRLNYAIVFVSDMKRSVAFYRDLLGLSLRFESPGWTEFATGGATLALHAGGEAAPPAGSPAPGGDIAKPAGRCRPGFGVADLDAFHRRVVGLGVTCVQEPSATFGVRIAQYLDPDGLVLSVSEARVDRP